MGIFNSKLRDEFSAAMKEASKNNNGDIHVVASEGKWAIKREGKGRALKLFPKKKEAIGAANKLLNSSKSEESVVIVHEKNGSIDKKY